MANREFKAWCNAATAKIRYGPDREAVAAELLGHMEDKYDALIESGLPATEAVAKTLESMGSTMEIAPQLGKIHRPWLGYLYSTTLAVAMTLWIGLLLVGVSLFPYGLASVFVVDEFDLEVETQVTAYVLEQDAGVFADGFYVRVTKSVLVPEKNTLWFQTKVTSMPLVGGLNALTYLWGMDDLGNLYSSDAYYEGSPTAILSHDGGGFSNGVSFTNWRIVGLDPQAKWVELHYDRDGRDIVIRLDLTGGVIYESP